jgi:HD-GYP domain-containing protein (c-di-GMP phosphodiesterase class II)
MQALGHAQLDRCLSKLRQAIPHAQNDALPAIDEALADLGTTLQLVLREHAGMTEELLRTYEQLGIVFEATRKLPTVASEDEVVRLFIDSLRVTYNDVGMYVARRGPAGEICWDHPVPPCAVALAPAVQRCMTNGQVEVCPLNPPQPGVAEMLAAPVLAGEHFVCAIVFTHDAVRPFIASDMNLVETLVVFCGDLIRNYRLAHALRRLSVDMVRALVGAVDQKDSYTSGHSNRVGYYARLLAAEIGLTDADLQMLEWAALLHDVGKIGIRDDVLKKAGKLTPEEFEHIKEHPVRSYEVVRRVPQLSDALAGVRHHHERYDGKGYPDGLAGEAIPLHARIILVADVFDALTTSRSYRGAFTWEKALGILREEAGKVSDPKLVEVFEHIVRREIDAGRLVLDNEGHLADAATEAPSGARKDGVP